MPFTPEYGPNEYRTQTELLEAHGFDCKSGRGIMYTKKKDYVVLLHVPTAWFYKDSVAKTEVLYTLQGLRGDQVLDTRYNKALMYMLGMNVPIHFIKQITLLGPRGGRHKGFRYCGLWERDPTYGKKGIEELEHTGDDGKMRRIYRIRLTPAPIEPALDTPAPIEPALDTPAPIEPALDTPGEPPKSSPSSPIPSPKAGPRPSGEDA